MFDNQCHGLCKYLLVQQKSYGVTFSSSAGITEGFSMCAGDFVEVYSHPSQAGKKLLYHMLF